MKLALILLAVNMAFCEDIRTRKKLDVDPKDEAVIVFDCKLEMARRWTQISYFSLSYIPLRTWLADRLGQERRLQGQGVALARDVEGLLRQSVRRQGIQRSLQNHAPTRRNRGENNKCYYWY